MSLVYDSCTRAIGRILTPEHQRLAREAGQALDRFAHRYSDEDRKIVREYMIAMCALEIPRGLGDDELEPWYFVSQLVWRANAMSEDEDGEDW